VECGLKESEETGPVTMRMKTYMESIQYGDEEHPWRYVPLVGIPKGQANH